MRYLVVGVCESYLDIILATDIMALADKAMADNYKQCAGLIACIDTVTGINLSNNVEKP